MRQNAMARAIPVFDAADLALLGDRNGHGPEPVGDEPTNDVSAEPDRAGAASQFSVDTARADRAGGERESQSEAVAGSRHGEAARG